MARGIDHVYEQQPFLTEDIAAVREVIRDSLCTGHPVIDKALKRFSDSSGKMLRPAMVMLAARLGRPDLDKIHRLAAAIELLHIATLVHDDIIDDSPLRRGVATLHMTEGIRKAVLIGDFLFTRCFRLTADFASPDAARILASGVGQICESEMHQNREDGPGLREYRRMIAGKTALLFMLSLSMGASESGCSGDVVSALRMAGYGIGMSFQITDDILDYSGRQEHLGKPTGNDMKDGLVTLPLILALQSGAPGLERLIGRRPGRRRDGRIRQIVLNSGSLEAARNISDSYLTTAQKTIGDLSASPARDALLSLVDEMILREK